MVNCGFDKNIAVFKIKILVEDGISTEQRNRNFHFRS